MVQDQEVEHVLEMWDALVVVVHESLEEDHSPRGADGNRGACVQGVDSAVSCDQGCSSRRPMHSSCRICLPINYQNM